MRIKGLSIGLLLCLLFSASVLLAQTPAKGWLVEVHGGAGDMARATTSAAQERAIRAVMTEAATAAGKVLDRGGSPVDAVEAGIRILEDSGLFDAGKGAILNAAGFSELDAAIMDGKTLKAGSVAAVRTAKHPITLARAVMDRTPHVMLVGSGADEFLAGVHGEQVPQLYFWDEGKWKALVDQLRREGKPVPVRPGFAPAASLPASSPVGHGKAILRGVGPGMDAAVAVPPVWSGPGRHYGTVGVVARDRSGNLAAGTSTGGSQGKMPGRVGDSPILGAGTYAANESCAVSATGVGEYFMRLTIARDVCALVQYKGMGLKAAADEVIHNRLKRLDGVGGLIAITPDGQAAWSFNTPGMNRARLREGGEVETVLYNDQP